MANRSELDAFLGRTEQLIGPMDPVVDDRITDVIESYNAFMQGAGTYAVIWEQLDTGAGKKLDERQQAVIEFLQREGFTGGQQAPNHTAYALEESDNDDYFTSTDFRFLGAAQMATRSVVAMEKVHKVIPKDDRDNIVGRQAEVLVFDTAYEPQRHQGLRAETMKQYDLYRNWVA